jgi:hypothetical protein
VRAAVPTIVEQVLQELEAMGLPARRRPSPLEPDLWWEPPEAGGKG